METKGEQSFRIPSAAFSRRGFLKASTTIAAAVGSSQMPAPAQTSGRVIAYIGTSFNATKGKGIYTFDVNTTDGTLTRRNCSRAYQDLPLSHCTLTRSFSIP